MSSSYQVPSVFTDDIRTLLPHRYPFLLVDKIQSLDLDNPEGACITGIKNVSVNEPFFTGHFPAKPIMPGVLTLESMAQVAGILGIQVLGDEAQENTIYYFAGADKVRFKRPVGPGDQLVLNARFLSAKCRVWKFDCSAYVDGEIACTAEVRCVQREL